MPSAGGALALIQLYVFGGALISPRVPNLVEPALDVDITCCNIVKAVGFVQSEGQQ